LRTKLSIKFLLSNLLAAVFSFLFCTQSMAEDLVSAATQQPDIDVSTTLTSETPSDITSDALSEAATVELEIINKEEEEVANPTAITADTQKPKGLPTTSLKNPYSQLVNLAFKGKGVNGVRNYAEAAAQYCKAARDSNDANAQFALGWMYVNGRGVEKNENVAALFFTKAAEQGHESAKNWLASSKGNALQADLPKCMLPNPPTITAQNNYTNNQTESVSAPFYSKGPIYKLVNKIAPRFKIETDLAMAFIAVESGFNPKATSPKNARGLMQLIPETAARFNVKNSYDPEDNIKGGLAYLQWLLTYFEGDVKLVAAAYNSGENAVEKYKGVPPYPETQKYVRKIASLYKKPFHPYRENSGSGKKYTG